MTLVPPPPPSGPSSEGKPPPQQPPEVLAGRYHLRRLLGRGGMASVYLAWDQRLEREVAVKILLPQLSTDPQIRTRFLNEARLLARLNHPHLVTVYDVGEEQGFLYLVMEYVEGEPLSRIIAQEAPMPLEEALYLMVQACAGVGYVHRAGLVHGDLKPANLLVRPDRRLKVTDFGLAGAVGLPSIQTDAQGRQVIWGSPRYFSPEHARGEPLLPASDVYVLGLILYEMLTGHMPYRANSTQAWIRAHAWEPPIPLRVHRPDLPRRLEALLERVLSKRPADRFRTADQFGRVLLMFVESEETRAVPMPTVEPAAAPSPQPAPQPTATPSAPPSAPAPATPAPATTTQDLSNMDAFLAALSDPVTMLLALLTLLALAGLIPLWVWVYLLYR